MKRTLAFVLETTMQIGCLIIFCTVICVNSQEPHAALPCPAEGREGAVKVSGYDAVLQLFDKDGSIGVHLVIKKTFMDWKTTFGSSWIGIYQSDKVPDTEYKDWKKAIEFIQECSTDDSIVYSYKSTMNYNLLAQARFFLTNEYQPVLAHAGFPTCNEMDTDFMSVDISGYDAKLQLFVKDGFTGTRLHISKTFKDWNNTFASSWVGFYQSDKAADTEHKDWKWAREFIRECASGDSIVYSYTSSMRHKFHAQARFFLTGKYAPVLEHTGPHVPICPVMDNRNVPVDISGYNAKLQLFYKDGFAGARLHISRTFKNWKNTFNSSWVGFYQSDKVPDTEHKDWKSATQFTKECATDDSIVYSYTSTMHNQFPAQARFFLTREYQPHIAIADATDSDIPPCSITYDLDGFDAKLQLFSKSGYVGIRLYIKKTFTDWQTVFRDSWVLLYTFYYNSDNEAREYCMVEDFEKEDSERYYEVYSYLSYLSEDYASAQYQAQFIISQGNLTPIATTVKMPISCVDSDILY